MPEIIVKQDSWEAVSCECPLHILEVLHRFGHYRHYKHPVCSGRVLCVSLEVDPPLNWTPTQAQETADAEGVEHAEE